MARYHLTDAGPMKCSAQIQCPLQKKAIENGEDPDKILHYDRKALADAAYVEKLEHKHEDTTHTGLKKSRTNDLGLTVEDVSKSIPQKFRDDRFYSNEQISGHIDIDQLDENSYKQFGFVQRTGDELYAYIESDSTSKRKKVVENEGDESYTYYSTNVSESELSQLSTIQRNVVNYYSGSIYRDVNDSIYKKDHYDKFNNEFPEFSQEGMTHYGYPNKFLYPRKEQLFQTYEYTPSEKRWAVCENKVGYHIPHMQQMSKHVVDKMINILDESLQKAPKRQRLLYRGAREEFGKRLETLPVWADRERAIGNVVEFDGYQSTSYSPYVAATIFGETKGSSLQRYSNVSCVLYEIRTPEGMAISNESMSPHEEEVLLPRGQRYVVVGKYHTEPVVDEDQRNVSYTVVQMIAVDENNNILDGTNSNPPKPWRK